MLLIPKLGKKPKKAPKPLRRSRIKPGRTKFAADFGDGKRCRRRSDADVLKMAQIRRLERLSSATPAELAMDGILRSLGVKFEREHIVMNGDRFCLLDFWLPRWNLVLEIDGSVHLNQKTYDAARTRWLASKGYKVARFWNRNVISGACEERIKQMLGL